MRDDSVRDSDRAKAALYKDTKEMGETLNDVGDVSSDQQEGSSLPFTPTEEWRVRLKLDLYVMPLLAVGFFVMQLDRGNISNALTDTLKEDVGITQAQVSTGASLLQAGIILFQLPSNALLQRIGAPRWLTCQLLLFGLVGLFQAWIKSPQSFMATRFILGACEAGYIPGAQYMLSLFYREKELALRTAILYFGNYLSAGTGGLIAAGILQLEGVHGLAGWRWLFILEGCITLIMFLVFVLLLPWSPENTKPVHGRFDFFSDREREILQARINMDHESKKEARAKMTWRVFIEAMLDYRLWMHCVLNIVSLTPAGGINVFGPSIIKALGFSKIHANLLASVPYFVLCGASFIICFLSDYTQRRGPWVMVALVYAIVWAGTLFGLAPDANVWTRYAIFVMLGSAGALGQALNDASVNINASSAPRRSVGLALAVMGSNMGGLAGANIFRANDAPRYAHAWLAILCLYASSLVIAVLIMLAYAWENRKFKRANPDITRPRYQP